MGIMEVRGLSFSYPQGRGVLKGIDLIIEPGEFILLTGPSGCGKTTFLRCMKSQIAPVGERRGTITEFEASEVGYVFQNPDNQIVTDTVRHELAFGLENMGLPTEIIRRRVAETALFFGIDEWIDASVYEISGGQKQLLNLAAVIAMRPKILLLDEPVSQLDPLARKNFLDVLVRVNRELGIAVLLSGHYMGEMLPLADRVIHMKAGAFRYVGDVQQYVRYILEEEPGYAGILPASAQIAAKLNPDEQNYPLTVREGRKYLEGYLKDREEIKREYLRAKWGLLSLEKVDSERKQRDAKDRENVCLLADQIWFQYRKQTPFVLKGLNLRIERGEFHVILGGNGSGKSTLLSILGKRMYANRGKIRLGKDKKMPKITLLTQNPKAMFSMDTVKEELEEAGCPQKLIQELGLSELGSQHPYDLSGGEQQRLGLAIVLSKEPDLLLLDEPIKGLDMEARNKVGKYLKTYAEQGHTVLCVTHDVEFAFMYADVCSLLFEGEILSTESTERFFEDNAFYTTDMHRIFRLGTH